MSHKLATKAFSEPSEIGRESMDSIGPSSGTGSLSRLRDVLRRYALGEDEGDCTSHKYSLVGLSLETAFVSVAKAHVSTRSYRKRLDGESISPVRTALYF